MREKSGPEKVPAEQVVKDMRRAAALANTSDTAATVTEAWAASRASC